MLGAKTAHSKPSIATKPATGRLFFLEVSTNRIQAMNPDGSNRKVVVTDCQLPDGLAIDVQAGHIYWTNMGSAIDVNDGSIERVDVDGRARKLIVPRGATFTPKQVQLDQKNDKLYWCDREGMRVMRCNLDGSEIETLIEAGRGDVDRWDATRWCIGIAIDNERRQIYWTQKGPENAGVGRIFRANTVIPDGEDPANRSDVELLYGGLPEPIHLEFDMSNRALYWTDRGDPPRGNTVNRARPDRDANPEILITHLMEGIGIAINVPGNQMFVTDLAGSIYSADLDGKNKRNLLWSQGNFTGIAYAEI
ncbi:3-hydroxyacyl-CoA dehydrogenase [Bradyrhizobium sp. SBR1B]|uniref:3-hydroxyacyl-CoA dehydrogenase n=1 Tax=Bradyrhizobium sp. SBR1B TaxID=2663836 RepID=UPI00160569C4|nr:3-hydroxyacyl-CoA dehydrogenase [Bradyrhizobium sp. SBR1B]MBB4380246.1 sugar lactone lactonase YvrE [Bradyrhizobium sp. SBR1B]